MKKMFILPLLFAFNIHPNNASSDNWNAQVYAQESNPQFQLASDLVADFPFQGDEQVVEFGCGNGRLAHTLLKKIPHGHIHGVDGSQEQIALAQKMHADNAQLSFECGDVTSFISAETYDVALSFMTLHWLGNDQSYAQALKQIAHSLKPGGCTFIAHLAEEGLPFIEDLKEILSKSRWQSYGTASQIPIHFPEQKIIEQAIYDAGFTIDKLTLKISSGLLDNLDAYMKHFMACPIVPFIPKELECEFYKEATERALQHNHITLHADGTVTHSGTIATLELTKQ